MAKKQRQPKPFPHFCPECGQTAVYPETITHETAFKHEGRLYQYAVPDLTVNKCRECGNIIFPTAALDRITDAFRAYAGLLTTSEIAENLKRLKLTQKEFAERIGIAQETISRWMGNVQVQSLALDNLMRLFFRLPEARHVLADAAAGNNGAPPAGVNSTDRPFPWRCGTCDQKEVYRTPTPYKTTIKYEGRPYDVEIPDLELPKCRNCGEVVFDNHAGHQIDRAFRQQLGLLQPEPIRAGRTELGLSQKEFAAQLGVAEESVSRWETGALIQSRVVDRQIRLFFELPSVRHALSRLAQGEPVGETVKSNAAGDVGLGGQVFPGETSAELEAMLKDRVDTVVAAWLTAADEVASRVPLTRLAPGSSDVPDILTPYRSYCAAATRYAVAAPREEVACITQVLSSLRERSTHGDCRRWFAAFVSPNSKTTAPISKRLAKITEELEHLPENDAPALLDHFRRLLQMWTRRHSPSRERLEKTILEE